MPATFELTCGGWWVLAGAALLVGLAKTALPGLVTLTVALCAAVLPARESTAVLLLLLLIGDVVAVWTYRHDADWHVLARLAPAVLVGVTGGAVVLARISDHGMRTMIGVLLLVLTGVTLALMWLRERGTGDGGAAGFSTSRPARWVYGGLGGFTTMVANAGGPPMTLYLIASGFDKVRFLGTQAWFFFLVNAVKLPLQGTVGLVGTRTFGTDLLLAPLVLAGAGLGRVLVGHISQRVFNPVILGLTVLSAGYLLV